MAAVPLGVTLGDEKLYMKPAGTPDAVSATAELNPPEGVTLIVDWPCSWVSVSVMLDGLAESVNAPVPLPIVTVTADEVDVV